MDFASMDASTNYTCIPSDAINMMNRMKGDTSIPGIEIPIVPTVIICIYFYVLLIRWIFTKLGLFNLFVIVIVVSSLTWIHGVPNTYANHNSELHIHERRHLDLMDSYTNAHFGHYMCS